MFEKLVSCKEHGHCTSRSMAKVNKLVSLTFIRRRNVSRLKPLIDQPVYSIIQYLDHFGLKMILSNNLNSSHHLINNSNDSMGTSQVKFVMEMINQNVLFLISTLVQFFEHFNDLLLKIYIIELSL